MPMVLVPLVLVPMVLVAAVPVESACRKLSSGEQLILKLC
jgi:hypothetical protein